MKYLRQTSLTLYLSAAMLLVAGSSLAQEKDINGARNSSADGISLDTNVSFTLRMTLAGEDTPLDAATLGQDVSVNAVIRPETEDIGQPTDVILVDFLPPNLKMRRSDGNFVIWNGSLSTLLPYLEDVTLESELDVEVFSGQLGTTGNHRIFVGFMVGDALYFTPTALRFDINEAVVEASALEQATELFESTISPSIVQARCIACHVANGAANGGAAHIFVRTSDSDHLTINFDEFRQVHSANDSQYILQKVQGMLVHGCGLQLTSGSTSFNDLSDFLDLLDLVVESE